MSKQTNISKFFFKSNPSTSKASPKKSPPKSPTKTTSTATKQTNTTGKRKRFDFKKKEEDDNDFIAKEEEEADTDLEYEEHSRKKKKLDLSSFSPKSRAKPKSKEKEITLEEDDENDEDNSPKVSKKASSSSISSNQKLQKFSFRARNNNGDDNKEDQKKKLEKKPKQKVYQKEKSNKKSSSKTKKDKYTPLEHQVIAVWEANPGVVLAVECGYRWRFFGSDAEKVAKILRILLVPPHGSSHFASCSVPSHRLNVHIHRLVNCGLKVGVVQQTETKALKEISDNRSKPFSRDLTQLYTKATLISPDIDPILFSEDRDRIDGDDGPDVGGYIMCLCEHDFDNKPQSKTSGNSTISMIAIQPSTGDLIFDSFEDDFLRTELETRLKHLSPIEFVIPPSNNASPVHSNPQNNFFLTHQTERILLNYSNQHASLPTAPASIFDLQQQPESEETTANEEQEEGDENSAESSEYKPSVVPESNPDDLIQTIRIERSSSFDYDNSVLEITSLYDSKESSSLFTSKDEDKLNKETLSSILTKFPKGVVVCLGALTNHLKDFKLEGLLKLSHNFRQFSDCSTLKLTSATLVQLEILASQDSFNPVNINAATNNINPYMKVRYEGHSKKKSFGSLFWVLNHTLSTFGSRLLKRWLTNPLLSPVEIEKRLDAVEELSSSQNIEAPSISSLRTLLAKIPDLERGICRLYYNKCSPLEFITIMTAFQMVTLSVANKKEFENQGFKSELLLQLADKISQSKIREMVDFFLESLSLEAAKENNLSELFLVEERFPDIVESKTLIEKSEDKIEKYLKGLITTLKIPLKYVTILQTEYLIEISRPHLSKVPTDWMKMSSTKAVVRYHTKQLVELMKELNRHREERKIACDAAWKSFVCEFKENYYEFRNVVKSLAEIDCLLSLSKVAQTNNFVRPKISQDSDEITIVGGRHPIVEKLIDTPFVDNDTHLSNQRKCTILTGPNMGGKSCYIRQVALIVLMAQIGSFVPCKSAVISPVDKLLVRMGAQDCIEQGRSTFFIEMQETSDILRNATSRSLIILDELGRGTSTHDGVSVAYASLLYALNHIRCFTLFVTHYHLLCQIEIIAPTLVRNYFMAFMSQNDEDDMDDDSIVFLYKLTEGMASKSYGFNVARLAGISESIIKLAQEKSSEMQNSLKLADTTLLKDSFLSIYKLIPKKDLQSLKSISSILRTLK